MIKLRGGDRARVTIPVRSAKPGALAVLRVISEEPGPDTAELEAERPRTRGDCAGGPRPCPWVSCRHHLYLNVDPTTGALQVANVDVPVWEMRESCALDVADEGGHDLYAIADATNVTRERVRQVEVPALLRLKRASDEHELQPLPRVRPSEPLPRSGRRRQERITATGARVLELLGDGWQSTGEVAQALGCVVQMAHEALTRLRASGLVMRRKVRRDGEVRWRFEWRAVAQEVR